MELSLVIPVYNEEENIEPVLQEINAVLQELAGSYEVLVIDDGSRDGTFSVLSRLCGNTEGLKIIRLKRNFGQTAALAAGLAHAQGDVVVMMDGDAQNDPRDIPAFLRKLADGYDLVAGWRHDRHDPFLRRRLPSMIANRLISFMTRVKLHDYGCTFKVMRREIAKDLRLYGEMHRFIPGIAYERGARVAELKVRHRPRLRGTSKYGILRTLRVVLDLLTVKFLINYSTRPSHVFGLIGVFSGATGFFIAAYLSVEKLVYRYSIGGRPLLLLAVLLIFSGFQFITMGLLGEMLARTYHESQGRAVFVVGEIVNGRKNA